MKVETISLPDAAKLYAGKLTDANHVINNKWVDEEVHGYKYSIPEGYVESEEHTGFGANTAVGMWAKAVLYTTDEGNIFWEPEIEMLEKQRISGLKKIEGLEEVLSYGYISGKTINKEGEGATYNLWVEKKYYSPTK